MSEIVLRFVTSDSIVSETIRKFEYGFWATHVETVMPDGQVLGAYLDKGVAIIPRYPVLREEVVRIPAIQSQFDRYHSFLLGELGKPYDKAAVIGIALERDWRDPGQWFCSELQAAALCDSGFFPPHLATDLNHVTPRDLLLIVSGKIDLSSLPATTINGAQA